MSAYMTIKSGWAGSGIVEDQAGVAEFVAGDKVTRIKFESFSDYFAVQELIDLAFELGREMGVRSSMGDVARVVNFNLSCLTSR